PPPADRRLPAHRRRAAQQPRVARRGLLLVLLLGLFLAVRARLRRQGRALRGGRVGPLRLERALALVPLLLLAHRQRAAVAQRSGAEGGAVRAAPEAAGGVAVGPRRQLRTGVGARVRLQVDEAVGDVDQVGRGLARRRGDLHAQAGALRGVDQADEVAIAADDDRHVDVRRLRQQIDR